MEQSIHGVSGTYPLSTSQQNIWDIERACPDTSINHICTTLRIQGRINFHALQSSVDFVLASDPSLRTRITLQDKKPVQYQAPFRSEPFPVYDFSLTAEDGVQAWERSFARENMPLFDAPLYRFVFLRTGESSCSLVVKMHHLISDGWTQVLLSNRIAQCYLDFLAHRQPDLGNIPGYETHLQDEQRYLASRAYGRDEAYWREVMSRPGEAIMLKPARGAALSHAGRRLTFSLPQDLNNEIYSFCMHHRVAPFSVFYMALAIYLKRIGGAERFTIGVPIFNRANLTARQTTGMFVSTLPFSGELSGDWTLNQFSEHLNMEWLELLRHQRFPFSHIQKLTDDGSGAPRRLFNIAFSYQNTQLLENKDAGVTFSGRWHYSGYQMEQLCIHLSNLEDERCYSVDYDYQVQLLSAREIETLHNCLVNILRQALADPDRPIGQLAILTPEERERVLYSFNRTAAPIYDRSLYARFTKYVRRSPNKTAVIWDGTRTSYRHIEESAARIHGALEGFCTPKDTLVGVLLPRSPVLFAAMMGVLRAGGAFLLLSPDLPEHRIREILTQSGAAALLTTPELGAGLEELLPLIDMNTLPRPLSAPPATYRPEGLAYVVYTSGSTGVPKGVEICCASLLNLACSMEEIYGKGAVMSVCSVGFDAFLLESVCALLNGRTVVLPRDSELESPKALAEAIRGYGVEFISTTPSRMAAYLKEPLFARAIQNLESIVCGGEGFPSDLLLRLQEETRARIYNQYGPSETTVAVSVKQLNGADAITAGRPMPNCKLYVLDHWGNPMPVGIFGKLYVGGVCVGRGYRNAPELTGASFRDNPFEPGDRLYDTGDIACWTQEGEIVLNGRSDRQVKLRGLRIEPQEVSECLARHPMVCQAAAAVQKHSGQDVLLAFYTANQPVEEDELLALCTTYLPHYMIPNAIMHVEQIPLTPNGKVNEAMLPSPDLSTSVRMFPQTRTQAVLLEIFRQVLEREDLGLDSDYFLFGGNSLNAMETLGEISTRTGRALRVSDLYACRTVLRLASFMERSGDSRGEAERLTAAPPAQFWPLTPIQQGIYIQSHMDPTGKTYHMAGAFRLGQVPDIPRLERAFRQLIAQEPLLRTAFVSRPDGIFARVQTEVEFDLPVFRGGSLEEAARPVLEPFDLGRAPLLRAALWEGEDGWVLMLNLHHIIGDGLTTPILFRRLDRLYRGEVLACGKLTYLDYAWHLEQRQTDSGCLEYWKEHLAQLPEMLQLPGDFRRSRDFDFRGGTCSHPLSRELSEECDNFCARKGISPYMLFLGAFGVLLSRLSGKEDLLVGAAAAGRLLPETREMCGPFINTLPLRLKPEGERNVNDYLSCVRDEVNGMLDHQQVGLEEIVSTLGIPRVLSQSPLFQVIFSQRPVDADGFSLDGRGVEYIPLSTGTARMELWVELAKENGRYTLSTEYAGQLFLRETAEYYSRCLECIVRAMVREEGDTLEQLEGLTAQDRERLIDIPDNTVHPFLNLPIPDQFDRQLRNDPNAPAVIFHGRVTTRRELDRRACQIANLLWDAGARPGCRVGIALSRNTDLVAAVLAIWKVGGAYVPLLAHFPEQRISYMVDTAGITHILCDQKTRPQLPAGLPCAQVSVWEDAPDTFSAVSMKEDELAEVLFTSGSTGRPKGVMLLWRSYANMEEGFRKMLERSDGPILCTTNVVFDMFNGEVVIPLAIGKTIVMADEEEMMLPWKLAEIIRRDGVKITQSTPSRVQMWLSNEAFRQACSQLELMIYGGEVLTPELVRSAQTLSGAEQVNVYGPTEGTVYNVIRLVDWREHINIGWPMLNNRVYILDDRLRRVHPTAAGELYLSGEGVSHGYVSRPDLTEKAYLPDPFRPGERMYRTGDIARLRLDGSYDFMGRRDAQVKLNGQRVELEEINGALITQNCALQAATVPVNRPDGSMALYTYYIPAPEQLDEGEIRARLSKVLPAYMVPARLLPLDAMPSTPTGKIKLRVLREMAQSADSDMPGEEKASAPVQLPRQPEGAVGSEGWILSLWQRVLSRSDVDPNRSFFEQGGTSLAALNMLSCYNNHALTISLSQFYEHPTVSGQAKLFAAARPDEVGTTGEMTLLETGMGGETYPAAVPEAVGAGVQPRCVLLTGATGFLGAHILYELLEQGAQQVICTMRDGDRARLEQTLKLYFGQDWVGRAKDRIEVLRGDITLPDLGLSTVEYQTLCGRIDSLWHCAADVRHYAADSRELMRTNVDGTRHMIRLARAAGAALYHMSTTSVAGSCNDREEKPALFTERDFNIGQDWRSNLYVRSKFLAEHAVYQAMEEGLDARVFRLGRLVGRARDGVFQKNPGTNVFWLLMRGICCVQAVPECMAQVPTELTPIDWCARAALALRSSGLSVSHLQSPTPPTMLECARGVCPQVRVVSDGEFEQLLSRTDESQGEEMASLINLWNQLKTQPPAHEADCALTAAQLEVVGFREEIPGPQRLLSAFRVYSGASPEKEVTDRDI